LRILIVNDFAHINGGASKVALGSAPHLVAAGHRVHLFSGAGPISSDLEGVTVTCLEEVPFQKKGLKAGLRDGMWNLRAREAFGKVLAECDPASTVVHVHTHRDCLSASVPSLAMEKGFSVLFTAHEYYLGCPYGTFFDQRKHVGCPERGLSAGCLKRPCNDGSYLKKLFAFARQKKHAAAGIAGRLEHVAFVSDFSERILAPYVGPKTRRHRLDNPVEVSRNPLSTRGEGAGGGETFLFVGTLHPGKDPLTFAMAAQLAGVRAIFVGKGELDREIREANPRAEVLGWVNKPELQQLYQQAAALVFPPIWPETQGLAVFEAAANGVPAIVTETCAARDFVERNQAGWLVRPGDVAGMAELLKRLAAEPSQMAEAGERAYRAFWQNPPTMERYVAEASALYELILAERKHG
jgi:glycosyltransferase involved in cell wall biosynthesis